MATKLTPKERWEALKESFLKEVGEIDKETPWGNGVEPEWWLEMMAADKAVRGTKDGN